MKGEKDGERKEEEKEEEKQRRRRWGETRKFMKFLFMILVSLRYFALRLSRPLWGWGFFLSLFLFFFVSRLDLQAGKVGGLTLQREWTAFKPSVLPSAYFMSHVPLQRAIPGSLFTLLGINQTRDEVLQKIPDTDPVKVVLRILPQYQYEPYPKGHNYRQPMAASRIHGVIQSRIVLTSRQLFKVIITRWEGISNPVVARNSFDCF